LSGALNALSECLSVQERLTAYDETARQWLAVAEKLTGDFPALHAYRLELARAHYALGRARSKLGDGEGSVRQRRHSVTILRALVKEHPEVPAYRTELSICLNGLAFALGRNWPDESRAAVAESLAVIRPLAAGHPDVPDYQTRLAGALINSSAALQDAGQLDESLANAQEAVAVFVTLAGTTYNVWHRNTLGLAYLRLAEVRRGRRDLPEARQAADRALATLEEVLSRDPRIAEAGQRLKLAHRMRAGLLAGLDLTAAEVKHGQRALSLAHAGKFNDALKEAEALAAQTDLSAEGCYTLARVYALLTAARKKDDAKGRERDAGRTLELLRRARDAGYFNDAARRDRLRREPDLAPLRDRADVKELVAGGT
jgi:tetratricopeptide (TPR) repeat protein